MKNKKGFTLVELLAVIVVLGIIMTMVARSVIGSVNESRKRTKFIAAKEIVEIADAYIASEGVLDVEQGMNQNLESVNDFVCISILNLRNLGYLEKGFTNPSTGKNVMSDEDIEGQYVCKDPEAKLQKDYEIDTNKYYFDGYHYLLK